LRRRGEREVAPFLFAGIEIMNRAIFYDSPEGAFSLNLLWSKAIEAGRIEALIHDGEWFHVGTPQGLAATEERLRHHGVMR